MNGRVHVAALAVSALVTAGLGAYAWRRRPKPAAGPFAGMMAATTVWTAGYAVALRTTDPTLRLLFEQVQWFGIAAAPAFLLLFATAYTGVDRRLTRRRTAALFVVPALTVLAAFTNPWHGLLWADAEYVRVDGVVSVVQTFGPWYWANLAYTYLLVGVGSALLLRLALRSEHLYRDQSALLAVGIAVPLVANAASVFGEAFLPGLDMTPYAFTVTGVAFGLALFRGRLLELVPATRQLGQRVAVHDLEDGVVVLDDERRVVYCNPAAAEAFDAEAAAALGRPAAEVVAPAELEFDSPDGLARFERDDRTYEVRTSSVTDGRGRVIGHTLVVQDVTERVERESRLERQRDELERLDRINSVVRAVNRALVGTSSPDAVLEAVPAGLADTGLYDSAVVHDAIGGTASAVADGDDVAEEAAVAAAEAARDAAGTVDPHARGDDGDLPTSLATDGGVEVATGVDEDAGAWALVPLVYGRTVYGTLTLTTDRTDAFAPSERAVLAELGETIGHAVNAAEKTRLLAADAVVEVTLSSRDDAELVDLAARTGATLSLDGIVPTEEHLLTYLSVTDADPDAVVEAATDASEVRGARAVGEDRVELALDDGTFPAALVECGANLRTLRVTGREMRAVAELASGSDVRTMLARARADLDVRLESKREVGHPVDRADVLPGDALSDLTDRQREALEAAYRAGYFEWPRDSTAEEVAEAMDVSAPTLHSHLRKAERKLLDRVLER
jgi:PAS domain-containing protein